MLSDSTIPSCPLPNTQSTLIRLGHGSGGKMSSDLIESVFLPRLGNQTINQLDDAAIIKVQNDRIAITTDSYVVSPIFFPGGDIGSLSVHGTVNDLAMRGARPLCLSCAFILEEGLPIEDLSKIIDSVARACADDNIFLAAADTKVVGRGAADKLFITTTGIGLIDRRQPPAAQNAVPGDLILVSGDIGRHGIAIMSAREELELETDIVSDSASLSTIVQAMLDTDESIHCMRDITRGGLSSILNELAQASGVGIAIKEESIPIHPQVNAVCELLGLDPFYVACEGRFVTIASKESVEKLVPVMQKNPHAKGTCVIGQVTSDHPGRVVLRSRIGGNRILGKLSGEQLPRIC